VYGGNASNHETRGEYLRWAQLVRSAHAELMSDPDAVEALCRQTGWTREALVSLSVGAAIPEFRRYGADARYVALPERDPRGRVRGVLMYLPHRLRRPEDLPGSRHRFVGPKADHPNQGGRGLTFKPNSFSPGERVLMVEGPACAVAMRSLGYPVVAYPSTSGLPHDAWAALMKRCEAIILPDAGDAGRDAASRVAEVVNAHAASVAIAPEFEGFGDIGDVVRELDPAQAAGAVEAVIVRAEVLAKPKRGRPKDLCDALKQRLLGWLTSDREWHVFADLLDRVPEGHQRTMRRAKDELLKEGKIVKSSNGREIHLHNPFIREWSR
jgi:hypothetical protein